MVPPPESSTETVTGVDTGDGTPSEQQERFETVSFDSRSTPRRILWLLTPAVAGVILLALVGSGAYSVRYDTADVPIAGREFDVLNVMYGLAVLFVGILVVRRVISSVDRTKQLLSRVRGRLLVLACSVYVAVLFVIGSMAPFVVSTGKSDPLISFQPPAWTSVSEVYVPTCHGEIIDGQCQGTDTHLLGTNPFGYDLLTVSLLGLNTTLQVAVTASVIAGTLGIAVGVAAGYLGGRVDELLMRYVDVQRALPAFFVYILLILLFARSYALMILVFGLLSWGGIARLVRSEVRQLRTTSYIRAARLSGAGSAAVIRRHILPAITGTVLTAIAVLFAKLVVYEASLAFLSLTEASVDSLGNEIARGVGRESGDPVGGTESVYDWWSVPWIIYVPAGLLCSLLLAVSLLGDRIQNIVDPRT